MRILINHLTRMHGGHICVAGVDLETRRHVRPMLAGEMLPFYLLARYGGPFEMSWVVDLGRPRPVPEAPHVEDHVFVPSRVKVDRPAAAHEFWGMLEELQQPSLRKIFGVELHEAGRNRYGTELGRGTASLGFLRPAAPPDLYIAQNRNGKPQVRMRLRDGEIEADAGVTDLRFYGDDHATADAARVRAVARGIEQSRGVILGVGLTRKFRASADAPYLHWLQVNNVHLPETPIWPLG
ncbi:MAG: hypothetical protein KKA28_17540 [Planctomycetes bacterium]|nr:hypothetical protein [Planctomycetota bacterium]MCG2685066.1 hypothetical protein [Planctomycetales bacterium]